MNISLKESACNVGHLGFSLWVAKIPWSSQWKPTPVFLLENSMDRGAWWAAVLGSQVSDMTE